MKSEKYPLLGYNVEGSAGIYFSKAQALCEAGGDINKVSLYFADDVYDNVDWSHEPEQDLMTLMKNEARRIRDNYDHVALWYSAGYDSQTVLDAFLLSGSPIDEVMIWERSWVPDHRREAEYACNQALMYKNTVWPNLKITHIKVPLESLANYYRNNQDWIMQPGDYFYAQKPIRNYPEYKLGTIGKILEKSRYIVLEGRDKPILDVIDGVWYARMNDKQLRWGIGEDILCFYFSPQAPEIHIKQCHMMMRWMEQTFENIDHEQVHKLQSHLLGGEMFCQWNLAIGRSPVNFSDAKYGQGIKKMNSVGGIEDQTIQKAFRDIDPKALNIFQSSLKELRSYYPDAWSSTGDMKTTLSKPQRIRPVKKTPKNTPLSSVLSKVDH